MTTAIASSQSGGLIAAFGTLIGNLVGVESKPIRFGKNGLKRSISIPGVVEQSVEGVTSYATPNEPMALDKTDHPANARLALAKSTGSHVHVFGLDWVSKGGNNGHFAPFSWKAA